MEALEELVCAARGPDLTRELRHAAFGRLVDRFQATIYARALHTLHDAQSAQDVTQETFLTAYQQLAQLREPRAFPAWLQQILRTHCNRIHRKAAPPISPLDAYLELADGELDPAYRLATCDVRESVLAALATLSEHERTVVQLFYFQDFSLTEIADRLKLPTTTVKKRLQYARNRLRDRLVLAQDVGILAARLMGCLIFGWPPLVACPVLVPIPRALPGSPQKY